LLQLIFQKQDVLWLLYLILPKQIYYFKLSNIFWGTAILGGKAFTLNNNDEWLLKM